MNILYIKRVWHATASYQMAYGITSFIVLLGIVFSASRVPSPAAPVPLSQWRVMKLTTSEDVVQPLAPPAVLPEALIWRPLGEGALVYSSLDGTIRHRYDWLRGVPVRWKADQSRDHIFLTWQTSDDILWVALLGLAGDQLTAPIELVHEVGDFDTALLDSGELALVFIQNGSLNLRQIDGAGRPQPTIPLETEVERAVIASAAGRLFVAWQTGDTLLAGSLDLSVEYTALALEDRITLRDFSLPADGWLTTLTILLPEDRRVILWGFSSALRPDAETYQGAVLPLDSSADPKPFSLELPDQPLLRWANRSADGQRLSLATLTGKDWQAVIVNFGSLGAESYQLVDGSPVTGGPIGMADSTLSWVTLDSQALPRLYATTLDDRFGQLIYGETSNDWREAVLQGLTDSPLIILWLITPLVCALLLRHQRYKMPLLVGGYWLGKELFPPAGLSIAFPSALQGIGISSPFVVSAAALFIISIVAAACAGIGWGRTSPAVRYAAFFLTDAVLTFAIFGARVELFGS